MNRVDIRNPPKAAEPIFGRHNIPKISDQRMVNRSLNLVAGSKYSQQKDAIEFFNTGKEMSQLKGEITRAEYEAELQGLPAEIEPMPAGNLDRDFLENAIATYNRL